MHAVLAQISAADPTHTGWLALLVALLGTGGLGALLGPYLKARAERERVQAEEESAMRRAKHEAELAQFEALTSMARSVPEQFEKLGEKFEKALGRAAEAQQATERKLDSSIAAVDAMSAELFSENRTLLRALVKHLGLQVSEDIAPASAKPQPIGVRPRLPSAPR